MALNEFVPYQHIEKLNTESLELEGLLDGEVVIQSKIDGTNGSLWWDGEKVCAGSRKREVSEANDNQGFFVTIARDEKYLRFFQAYPTYRLYGEFGIKNHIKNYSSYKDFHVFDIVDEATGEYIHWKEFDRILSPFDIKFIPIVTVLNKPTMEEVLSFIDKGLYLCNEDTSPEGIVIKRQGFKNKFGRTVWGKLIRGEYLIQKKVGNVTADTIEGQIVDDLCTKDFIIKEYYKLKEEIGDEWSRKYIGRLLGTVFYVFINENAYTFIRKYKSPTINFRLLNLMVNEKIKTTLPSLFAPEYVCVKAREE